MSISTCRETTTTTDMWWESTQPWVSPAVLEAWTASILRGIDASQCIKTCFVARRDFVRYRMKLFAILEIYSICFVGHPGTRNDKHIVRTDQTAMDLLEGNGWLNSKTWCSTGVNGIRKLHRGVYLICDGGTIVGRSLSTPTRIQYLVLQS